MGSPPADSIAIDWQLQCEDIPQRGVQVLKSGLWSDCTFVVGPEQVSVPAHRLLLAMASPVFQAMFYGSMAAGSDPVKISDMDPDVFKAILHYIYTDNVTTASFDSVCGLYYAARKYMLQTLASRCLAYIRQNLLAENVCQAYELATLFDEEKLAEACLKEICSNTSEVVKACSFEHVELSTLLLVVSQESLNIGSELELLRATERCARRRCGGGLKRGLDMEELGEAKKPKLEDEKSVDNFEEVELQQETIADAGQTDTSLDETEHECRASLRKALEHIRFLTLSAAQFVEAVADSALLTEGDAFALLVNIAHPPTAEPLPPGFSASRERRTLPEHMRTNVMKVVGEGAHASEVVIEYTVSNIKSRKRAVESEPYMMQGGINWRLRVVPEESDDAADKAVGVYVNCRGPAAAWRCPAELTVTVRHPSLHKTVTCQYEFNRFNDTHGWARLAAWDDVCGRGGCLKGNQLTFEAHICAELNQNQNDNDIHFHSF